MIILIVLMWAAIVYLLLGCAVVGLAVWFWFKTERESVAYQFDWLKNASWKMRTIAVLLAVWYGVICWLPIAAGWMTRPTKFH